MKRVELLNLSFELAKKRSKHENQNVKKHLYSFIEGDLYGADISTFYVGYWVFEYSSRNKCPE